MLEFFSMKKFLLGIVGIAALGMATSASAADLAGRPYTKAPPMMAAIYDWSGFYLGANGGWGSSHQCWNAGTFGPSLIGDEGCHDATGAVAGGQVGYRWQSSAWVFGLEAQGDWADLRGSQVNRAFPGLVSPGDVTNRSRVDGFGLFTGQVGYAWNNVLLYVKGGAAVTRDVYEAITTVGSIVGARATETRWGETVGAGLEFGFAPNWSLGVEYDHLFMGSKTLGLYSTGLVAPQLLGPAGTLVGTNRLGQDADLVTVRVNYRWGGAAVARY
jgi:outer membrane immunogenic protein